MTVKSSESRGPGILGLLGIVFVVLKLTGVIDWSWWWVTLPFYGVLALFISVAVLIFICAACKPSFWRKRK